VIEVAVERREVLSSQVRKGLEDRKSKCRAILSWSRREVNSIR